MVDTAAAAAQASTTDMRAELSISGLPAITTPTIDTGSLVDSAPHIAQSLGLPLPPLSGDPIGAVSSVASLDATDVVTSVTGSTSAGDPITPSTACSVP
jgi:hypothetical protein